MICKECFREQRYEMQLGMELCFKNNCILLVNTNEIFIVLTQCSYPGNYFRTAMEHKPVYMSIKFLHFMSSFNTFCVESFRINSQTLYKLAKIFGSKIETKLELFVIPIKMVRKIGTLQKQLELPRKIEQLYLFTSAECN